jgi:hypothetical protein
MEYPMFRPPSKNSIVRVTMACAVAACVGCVNLDRSEEAAEAVRGQSLGDLPYHPFVYHLDLSILAYQLYSQSLAFPFDPYYEDIEARDALMAQARDWAATMGTEQVASTAGIEGYRGPGSLNGFDDNPAHDPLIYRYSQLHPWSDSITNAAGTWTEYLTPFEITEQIRDVFVCSRPIGGAEDEVNIDQIVPAQNDAALDAEDVLMAFEGGTGDKTEPGQPASQSLMGFALLRAGEGDNYDLHVSFRGSRSGSAVRAALEAFSTEDAAGNPDWITDLGYTTVEAPWISRSGSVSRGMSRAVQILAPQLFGCLDGVAGDRATPPRNIYVTGHSLGGALAQHFVSAVMMGDQYGPDGEAMPESLVSWPWRQTKLISMSAPRVGEDDWAEELTTEYLEMDYFRAETQFDLNAIGVTDLDIIPRLTDPNRPAGYRVLIPTDPITTSLIAGGKHVGKTVYVALPRETAPSSGDDHEPAILREMMVDTLRDPERIPALAWMYREMDELHSSRDPDEAGSPAEYEKLAEATKAYYSDRDLWFDHDSFDASFLEFQTLLQGL